MEIRKIAGIAPDDRAAVDEAFAGIEPLPVACCNWPAEFPVSYTHLTLPTTSRV